MCKNDDTKVILQTAVFGWPIALLLANSRRRAEQRALRPQSRSSQLTRAFLVTALFIILASAVTPRAHAANCTSSQVGQFTYKNCSDGYNSTENTIGKFTYGTDSKGNTWTKQRIGEFEYSDEGQGEE
jgi:hypothetical protein